MTNDKFKTPKPYDKGKRFEYRILWKLTKYGWFAVRAPASGKGSSKLFYPDIIAYRRGKLIGIEAKMRLDGRDVLIDIDKFNKLSWLSKNFGFDIYVCAVFDKAGQIMCLKIDNYTYKTDKCVVYKRFDFEKKGLTLDRIG